MKNKAVLVLLIMGLFLILGYINEDKNWTLMVCSTKHNDAECYDNEYVIPGFSSQKDCMLEGAKNFSEKGFECGKGCEDSGSGLQVCDVVCNKAGCSK